MRETSAIFPQHHPKIPLWFPIIYSHFDSSHSHHIPHISCISTQISHIPIQIPRISTPIFCISTSVPRILLILLLWFHIVKMLEKPRIQKSFDSSLITYIEGTRHIASWGKICFFCLVLNMRKLDELRSQKYYDSISGRRFKLPKLKLWDPLQMLATDILSNTGVERRECMYWIG